MARFIKSDFTLYPNESTLKSFSVDVGWLYLVIALENNNFIYIYEEPGVDSAGFAVNAVIIQLVIE